MKLTLTNDDGSTQDFFPQSYTDQAVAADSRKKRQSFLAGISISPWVITSTTRLARQIPYLGQA
jgi:hypothetical protein